jgi:hypothetical protein
MTLQEIRLRWTKYRQGHGHPSPREYMDDVQWLLDWVAARQIVNDGWRNLAKAAEAERDAAEAKAASYEQRLYEVEAELRRYQQAEGA